MLASPQRHQIESRSCVIDMQLINAAGSQLVNHIVAPLRIQLPSCNSFALQSSGSASAIDLSAGSELAMRTYYQSRAGEILGRSGHLKPAASHGGTSVWPHRVVLLPPLFGANCGLPQRVEDLPIQKLVSQCSVEGFDEAVLPPAIGFDEQRLDADPARSLSNSDRCELGAVVRSNVLRNTSTHKQIN